MSITPIMNALENLVTIHHDLVEISKQKTEHVTEGQIDEFQNLLLKERKYIFRLEQAERKRQEAVEQWFQKQNAIDDEMTIKRMLEQISNEQDQVDLASVTTELTEMVTSLKHQEQLNRELLEQSMQFVQMSLNMINPSIEQMNYGDKEQFNQRGRSVFDSRA